MLASALQAPRCGGPASPQGAGVDDSGWIDPGESDGKDAGFIALREMLSERTAPGALRANRYFLRAGVQHRRPRARRAWKRPNKVGPEETGWRTTAQNLNLNRDYVKADAPEMRAMLRLLNSGIRWCAPTCT